MRVSYHSGLCCGSIGLDCDSMGVVDLKGLEGAKLFRGYDSS